MRAMHRLIGALILIAFPLAAFTQQTAPGTRDEVWFMNGDRLQGEIKSVQRGELTFSADEVNDDVTIKLKDIRMLKAKRMLYIVEDIYARKYYGVLDSSRFSGWVSVHTATGPVEIFLQDLDNIRVLDENLWNRIDGSVSLGFSYTRSSQVGRINGGGDMRYNTRKWVLQLNSDIMYTMDQEYKGIEKADLSLQGYFEFRPRWFNIGLVQFQRITELGVDARFQGIVGVGPTIIKNRYQDFRVASGISLQQEYGSDDAGEKGSFNAEIPLVINYFLYRPGHPDLRLQSRSTLFFSLSDKGRWRADQNATLTWKIVRHLSTSLQVYLNYDSQPLVGSSGAVDYGVVFSIGYSF